MRRLLLLLSLALAVLPAAAHGTSSSGLVVSALRQVAGLPVTRQSADHSETRNRCAGRLQEEFGSNMWSWSTKSFA